MIRNFIVYAAVGLMTAVSCVKEKPAAGESQTTTTREGEIYEVDTLNSKVEWKGYKVLKTDNTSHFGTIKFESGNVTVKNDRLESGKFVANMATLENIDLKDEADQKAKLENHLKSKDFFDTEKFPTATFEITKITPAAQGDYNTALDGKLTIKGITKPVQFNANVVAANGIVSIATEPKDISRDDFGIKFQMPAANGIIKDEINIQVLIKALVKK